MKKMLAASIALGAALILLCFQLLGYEQTWTTIWNIPAIMPPFQDMRMITGAAQTLKAGIDPSTTNIYDPSHQRFNYPGIWLPLLRTPMDLRWTVPLAILSDLLALVGVVLFPGKLSKLTVAAMLFALFSPAVMLGMERANIDGLFFFLVSLSLFLMQVSVTASLLVLMIAVLFKLFPVFAAGSLLGRDERAGLRNIAVTFALTAAYFLVTLPDMQRVFRTTLKGDDVAYGVTVLIRRLVNELAAGYAYLRFRLLHIPASVGFRQLELAAYVLAALLVGLVLLLGWRARSFYQGGDQRNLLAFRAGAGIYVGTFLLGNNHDYRLMFLLFTLPLLVEWAQHGPKRVAPLVTLLFLMLSLWYLDSSRLFAALWPHGATFAYLLDEFSNWGLMASLAYLYSASLPADLPATLRGLLPWRRKPALDAHS